MTMTKRVACLLTLACTFMLAGCKTADSGKSASGKGVLYACACGADCKCSPAVSTKPGKCGCGRELTPVHLLKVEGEVASLCMCGADCKCTGDAKDTTKCGCGKPLQKVSLKGSGIYFCNCGGSCACCTFSEKPGKCKCGMELKKAI